MRVLIAPIGEVYVIQRQRLTVNFISDLPGILACIVSDLLQHIGPCSRKYCLQIRTMETKVQRKDGTNAAAPQMPSDTARTKI